jgi:hypothetical protein
MRGIHLFITLCLSVLNSLPAQVLPNAVNYSAVARNATGQTIASSTIGIQIGIIKSNPTGPIQYSENHIVATNQLGVFNLIIGAGSVQSGSFSSIDWSSDNFYLKVGMDVNGGTNFISMGTTQLFSVPYALHSKTAESVVGGSFNHRIGEEFGGGVIFYLWKSENGEEHGLIVDKTDLDTSCPWSNVGNGEIGLAAQSLWNGLGNSLAIVSQAGHTNSAASLCLNSTNGGQTDWYLPSIDELSLLYQKRFIINKTLSGITGAKLITESPIYLSSTEHDFSKAWYLQTIYGGVLHDWVSKTYLNHVRAVRAF